MYDLKFVQKRVEITFSHASRTLAIQVFFLPFFFEKGSRRFLSFWQAILRFKNYRSKPNSCSCVFLSTFGPLNNVAYV